MAYVVQYSLWEKWYTLLAARCGDIDEEVRNRTAELLTQLEYLPYGAFPKVLPLDEPVPNPSVRHCVLTLRQRSL